MDETFLRLSALLTGFDPVELAATGVAEELAATVREQVGPEGLDRLSVALAEAGGDPPALADPALLELARALCALWYLGHWPGLPEPVCRSLGLTGGRDPLPPTARTYAQGLLWRAMGGHAPGTAAPGFGSWAEPPALIPPAAVPVAVGPVAVAPVPVVPVLPVAPVVSVASCAGPEGVRR